MRNYGFWCKTNVIYLQLQAENEEDAWERLENILATDVPEHIVTVIDDKTPTTATLSIVNLGNESDWEIDEACKDENRPVQAEVIE